MPAQWRLYNKEDQKARITLRGDIRKTSFQYWKRRFALMRISDPVD
jgi:hypothetical protein